LGFCHYLQVDCTVAIHTAKLAPVGPALPPQIRKGLVAMARIKRGARTQAVRDYLAGNPEASPKEVVEGLQQKGIKVKVTLVNSIKYKKPSKGAKRRRSPAVQSAARMTSSGTLGFEQLIEVKRLVDGLGGAEQVRQALDALAQLQ
jgi:hypothetical protein